jgi:glycerol-3-phosphate acyltransferase PlsX
MRVALDAMGGDFAPQSVIEGAIRATETIPNVRIILVGRTDVIEAELARHGVTDKNLFEIVHADEVIEMGEHPTKALAHKPHNSISVGYNLLKNGQADAFCSAGNTGAMLVGAVFTIRPIEGILRPAIAGFVPKTNGGVGVMVDVGANADVKPEHLVQFGEIGSLYAQYVLEIDHPKVGLMNLGEEEQKGTLLTQAAYQGLKQNKKINFIGNIEGRDVFNDKADVIVCDGFTGNVITKMAESVYEIMHASSDQRIDFFERLNYETVGGSPIIGVNGSVVIGHGVSTPAAFCKMVDQAMHIAQSQLHEKIRSSLNSMAY